eukprot:2569331-Rhodomonas_salina.3
MAPAPVSHRDRAPGPGPSHRDPGRGPIRANVRQDFTIFSTLTQEDNCMELHRLGADAFASADSETLEPAAGARANFAR